MELFPVCTACAASATAFNPEPHTLLIVMAPVAGVSPPKMAACRAGFCPSPAETTLPMMHSSTCAGLRLARFTTSRTTMAPSWVALRSDKLPWNFPTGVRQAEKITTSSRAGMGPSSERVHSHYRSFTFDVSTCDACCHTRFHRETCIDLPSKEKIRAQSSRNFEPKTQNLY